MMKKAIVLVCCVLMWDGQALAASVCVGSIISSTPAKTPATSLGLVDNGDATVTHFKSGLMWKQCSEGLSGVGCATGTVTNLTWQSALQTAESNNTALFAGFSDWRLPNLKELNSIVEEKCSSPAINEVFFPGTVATSFYWSASPYAGSATAAWSVGFTDGSDIFFTKTSNFVNVRLVRGGQ